MMGMKKNGFTLIELLAVIVIMALLLTIAVPAVIGVSTRIRTKMYCTKVEDIESAAKIYGENYKDVVEENGGSITITVYNLIENNLYKKEDKDCDSGNLVQNNASYCVLDPRNSSSMDMEEIEISIKDKRIATKYLGDKSVCTN